MLAVSVMPRRREGSELLSLQPWCHRNRNVVIGLSYFPALMIPFSLRFNVLL